MFAESVCNSVIQALKYIGANTGCYKGEEQIIDDSIEFLYTKYWYAANSILINAFIVLRLAYSVYDSYP